MDETTKATLGRNTTVTATNAGANSPGVNVTADSDTDILSVAGALGVSAGAAGIGAGVNVHTLDKDTAFLEEVRNVARSVASTVKLIRSGKLVQPDRKLHKPRTK
ncbi:MAG: hypothetical protein EOO78_11940 [Oxalobacteraceae bacterium]|nr:MAG: hypothetical protein EOO78_11940 [Oxalobacteraceae bacterium]